MSLSVLYGTFKRNCIITKRVYPWSFVLNRILVGVYTVLISYFSYSLFGGQIAIDFITYSGTSDYLGYVVFGAAQYTLGVSIWMNVARSLMIELREGTLETLLLSPASLLSYLIGIASELLGRSIIGLISVLLTGWMMGIGIRNYNLLEFFVVFVISVYSFFAVGVLLAVLMLSLRDTYITQNTVSVLASLICGIAFPIQYLPQWLQEISNIFPLTYAVQLFRKVVLAGHSVNTHIDLLVELFLLSTVYVVIGYVLLKWQERRIFEKHFG